MIVGASVVVVVVVEGLDFWFSSIFAIILSSPLFRVVVCFGEKADWVELAVLSGLVVVVAWTFKFITRGVEIVVVGRGSSLGVVLVVDIVIVCVVAVVVIVEAFVIRTSSNGPEMQVEKAQLKSNFLLCRLFL